MDSTRPFLSRLSLGSFPFLRITPPGAKEGCSPMSPFPTSFFVRRFYEIGSFFPLHLPLNAEISDDFTPPQISSLGVFPVAPFRLCCPPLPSAKTSFASGVLVKLFSLLSHVSPRPQRQTPLDSSLVRNPFFLSIAPSKMCFLACPGSLHSSN